MLPSDDLKDFNRRSFSFKQQEKAVFVRGTGPAVVVMHEVFGLTPEVARLCRWISEGGFTVYAPALFGTPGKAPGGKLSQLGDLLRVCVRREFRVFAANRSSPVVDWLKLLALEAFRECGGSGVGVIGLCLTGNFGLAMAVEPCVLAPVLGEPSLPAFKPAGLHITTDDLAVVQRRVEAEGFEIQGYRFAGDPGCSQQRFESLERALKQGFSGEVLPDECGNPQGHKPPHSVFTIDLIDRQGERTREAVNKVIAFFQSKLSVRSSPIPEHKAHA